ncbi:hypothetical protein MMYC01_205695 [Madurella mycetomatis]|uniref:Uncharacterized protein n=1 Tax=Madurella mycetomatis TaxID=100816 RepID=A0A175W4G0_9PEZI|nr:hypothetical protein MMYC01_205695 [Madurella mycetomatis]
MSQTPSSVTQEAEAVAQGWPQVHFHGPLPGSWKGLSKSAATSRSPSPVTSSESSRFYAPSTSSFATSAGPAAECGFPNDDEADRWTGSERGEE